MQDAYHTRLRQIAAQNALRAAHPQARAQGRARAVEAPVLGPIVLAMGALSLVFAAYFTFQSF